MGGTCLDILDTILDVNDSPNPEKWGGPFDCLGFVDDNPNASEDQLKGFPYLGSLDQAQNYKDCFFINGIGSPRTHKAKRSIIEKLGISNDHFLSIIHPTASLSRYSSIGKGVVIFQNVTLTTNTIIGDHVVILPNSIISHDVTVGSYSCIAGGVCLSGKVSVGESCYLGTNCSVRDSVYIGDNSLVGMGSVVINDIEADSIVKGIPAK